MNRASLWISAAILGAAAALIAGVAGVIGLVFLVLCLPLALRSPRPVTLAGYLVGAGTTWLVLLGRQIASGGSLERPMPWVAVGAVALAFGLALTTVAAARRRDRPASSTP